MREDREVDDSQGAVVRRGRPLDEDAPIRGVITMLPALTPTQTVSGSDGSRSASPDSRIQWHRYVASPPSTRSTSASRTQGTHRSAPMVGSAVSSRTPSDAQPRPEECCQVGPAATKPCTDAGPHIGWPHCAVGTQRAWHSAIGLPSICSSAERMLGFVTPPDVSKSFMVPPRAEGGRDCGPGIVLGPIAVGTTSSVVPRSPAPPADQSPTLSDRAQHVHPSDARRLPDCAGWGYLTASIDAA